MVNFYVYRIKAGRKLWTAVPKLWQGEVNAKLLEDGTVSKSDQIN